MAYDVFPQGKGNKKCGKYQQVERKVTHSCNAKTGSVNILVRFLQISVQYC